jgi:hypothetical protein
MSDREVQKHCDTCEKVTPHIESGSGHKSVCMVCESSEEYGYEEGVAEPDPV